MSRWRPMLRMRARFSLRRYSTRSPALSAWTSSKSRSERRVCTLPADVAWKSITIRARTNPMLLLVSHSCALRAPKNRSFRFITGPQCRAPSIHLPNGDASSLPPAIDKEQLIKIYRHEQVQSKHIGHCSLCQNESANLHGRCFQCQENYCQTCYAYHAHFHRAPSHITRTFNEIRLLTKAPVEFDESISLVCAQRHNRRPFEFFCTKCSECLCAECLIDEQTSHHRKQSHTIKLLSQVAQDNRYQLERLYVNKFKSLHRELIEAIEYISKILDRDPRLFLVFDQLQKQEEKANELEKLIETLVNHAHDVHVVLYEKQAKDQLTEILHERPPRPRQGFLLNGLRFELASSECDECPN